jgi:Histidine kinase-, DNA gyrase B-, and HSP90-like ATPase
VHRQLKMLDTMERTTTDSEVLEGLFKLDHLTTRMRRHAEGLVILSGSPTARGWRHPVGFSDILRSAAAEVEDYTRVRVTITSPAALAGIAVVDVIHLIAELVENATTFSPPPTQVHVEGEVVAKGYAIEIEDRGIGMDETELGDANLRLMNSPEFDLADSDRLGLFVVGRLAARHEIQVTLRPSPYGGVKAIVLIPAALVLPAEQPGFDEEPADLAPPEQNRFDVRDALTRGRRRDLDGDRFAGSRRPPPSRQLTGSAFEDAGGAAEAYRAPATPLPGTRGRPQPRPALPDPDELPRRIRQTHLVPQLRTPPPQEAMTTSGGSDDGRSPEDTRDFMSSLQQGWRRGRETEEPDDPRGFSFGPRRD